MQNPAFSTISLKTFILLNGEQVWTGIAVIYLWPRSQLSTCQLVAYRYFVTSPASRHWDSSLVAAEARRSKGRGQWWPISYLIQKRSPCQCPVTSIDTRMTQKSEAGLPVSSIKDCDLFYLSFIGDQQERGFKTFPLNIILPMMTINAPLTVSGNRVSGIYGFEKLPSNHLLLISDRKDSSYHHKIAASRCFLCS